MIHVAIRKKEEGDTPGTYRRVTFLLAPTKEQAELVDLLFLTQAQVYNEALWERTHFYKASGYSLGFAEQCRRLTDHRSTLLDDDPHLLFGRVVADTTLRRVDSAFQSFFRRVKAGEVPGYPRAKAVSRFKSVEYSKYVSWKLIEPEVSDVKVGKKKRHGRIYIQGVGHVKARWHLDDLPGVPVSMTLRRKAGRTEASVVFKVGDVTPAPRDHATEIVVGVDRGVNILAATSDGRLLENVRAGKRAAKKVELAQQELARKKRGSKNWKKAAKLVARLKAKEGRVRLDALHKASAELAAPGVVVVFEDLDLTAMTKSAKGTVLNPGKGVKRKSGLNRAVLDSGLGALVRLTTYKAAEAGGWVDFVPAPFTSQTCGMCGHVHGEDRVKLVWSCCKCGYSAHADTNAGDVIAQRYEELTMAEVSTAKKARKPKAAGTSTKKTKAPPGA